MKWLRRQWFRVQLARELLEQYEWEEAHRVPFPEALRRLDDYARVTTGHYETGVKQWSAATKVKAAQYPDG